MMKGIGSIKGIGGVFGIVVCSYFILPLYYCLMNLFFYSPKVTDEQIDKYIMADSVIITTHLAKRTVYDIINRDKEIEGPGVKYITISLGRRDKHWPYQAYLFYEKDYKKYFLLIAFDTGGFIFGIDGQNVVMKVNKNDLNNPALGAVDNPVPVLKFWGADKSLREDDKDYNKAWMDNDYRINVKSYLEYIMPKKEFKERFGK